MPVSDAAAPHVAREITEAVKPVLVNATNSEPWYRSRIYIGLIAAGVGAVAQHFGVQISGADVQLVTNSIPELVQLGGSIFEVLGLLYAAYGRVVGASKPALGK
ncbi:hypothetical protein [Devosia sp. 919]|uniref:hypothetical protein n=1 Tax=Devosia sp. 919 TaxID=2726065 RepID=UPI001551F081|nr:hypothetical protein [Devosia sp. 919]